MRKLRYFIFAATSVFIANAKAVAFPQCESGFDLDPSGVCMPNGTGLSENTAFDVLSTFLNWALAILAIIAVIAFVIAGIQYITSAGNENQIETAKRNLTWSIVGLAIALSSIVVLKTIAGIVG